MDARVCAWEGEGGGGCTDSQGLFSLLTKGKDNLKRNARAIAIEGLSNSNKPNTAHKKYFQFSLAHSETISVSVLASSIITAISSSVSLSLRVSLQTPRQRET